MNSLFSQEELDSRIQDVESRIDECKKDPGSVITRKIQEVDYHLARVSRGVSVSSNFISMRENLEQIRRKLESDPLSVINEEIKTLQAALDGLIAIGE